MRANGSGRQAGFIITIELLLVTTILVIGSLAGLVAIRDALIKRWANQQSQQVTVYDAGGVALGKAVGFDEHEAPLLAYIDRGVPPLAPDPGHRNYRALIGVRDDRFTSREPVYYAGPDCTGTPCIKAVSDEVADNTGLSGLPATGAVGYLHALQGGPNYAIGAAPEGFRGRLYRSTSLACPVAPTDIQSRYLSQKVVTGSPCENRAASSASGYCEVGLGPCTATDPATCSCITEPVLAPVDCGEGISQQSVLDGLEVDVLNQAAIYLAFLEAITDPSGNYTRFLGQVQLTSIQGMDICCPEGSTLLLDGAIETAAYLSLTKELLDAGLPNGQLTFLLADLGLLTPSTEFSCTATASAPASSGTAGSVDWGSLQALAAEPVPDPSDPAANTLDRFVPPFSVNLPIDMADDSWIYTPPNGEGW